jgi:hypothetical protein
MALWEINHKKKMAKLIILFIFLLITSFCFAATPSLPERYYQKTWCAAQGGQIEVTLIDRTRVDCLTEDYAIEFDFARKWAEAPIQALHYARLTKKFAGVVIICKKFRDKEKLQRLRANIQFWRLPIRVWTINCE